MTEVLEKQVIIPAHLEEEFDSLLNSTFSAEPVWLKGKRSAAFDAFSVKGIPGRKSEEYKYTDVKKIFSKHFTSVHNEQHTFKLDINKIQVDKDSIKLVFVNGWLYKDSTLSAELPEGVIIGSMAADALFLHREVLEKYLGSTIPDDADPFALLNSTLWFDGAFIYIPEGVKLGKTIEIIHISTGNEELLVSPRNLIIAEKNSESYIIEHSISLDVKKHHIVNSLAEVVVGENAHLSFYKIQSENQNISQLHNTFSTQGKKSVFDTCTVTIGSDWVRNNLTIAHYGEYCETHLNGLFITNGSQHIDNHTLVDHCLPNCQSNQLYKGILDDKSTGVFNGKIFVRKDAQKTNAYQSSKNILLNDNATINTKPQLEIYADDVKCSHGSSTGQIDPDAMFYLRSRGLSEDSAKNLLMYAFAADAVNTIRIDSVKEFVDNLIAKRLNHPN